MCVCVCVLGGYNPEVFLVGVAGQASLPEIRRILDVLCAAGLRPLKTLRQRNELPLQALYSLQKVFARTNSWPLQNYPDKFMAITKGNCPDKFMAVTKGICLDKFKPIVTSMAVFS